MAPSGESAGCNNVTCSRRFDWIHSVSGPEDRYTEKLITADG